MMAGMAAAVSELESCFRQIQPRHMQDMPLLNDALQVAAVGFRPCFFTRLPPTGAGATAATAKRSDPL